MYINRHERFTAQRPETVFRIRRLPRQSGGDRPLRAGGWEINGETVETVSDFILAGSKITADGDCSHEIIENGLVIGPLFWG